MNSGTGRQRTTTAGTDARRELILQAATRLFASQGYAQTTLDHIAKDMGVSKPFIYYYFRDKQELFEVISWQPVMDCFSALDFAANDPRPAATKAVEGLRGLIQATIQHHPASFFYYREPQVFRSEFIQAVKQHSHRFYDTLCPLLEQARADGALHFRETKITALAACSLPGFLYSWYQPDGRLTPSEVVDELTLLASRVIGLQQALPSGTAT